MNLLIFFVLFFLVALALPTYRTWRATGLNPLVLPTNDSAEGFVGRAFKAIIIVLAIYLVVRALGFVTASMFGQIAVLDAKPVRPLGWTILVVSMVWVVMAQMQMGNSWRVGIDSENKTDLINVGIFKLSRNPIFLGMVAMMIGILMIEPNGLTLAVAVSGFCIISVQVRLEESHLLRLHGASYEEYCRQVRRWL